MAGLLNSPDPCATLTATAAPVSTRDRLMLVLAVTAVVAVFAMGTGVSYPLLSLLLARQGYSAWEIGLNAAMMPLGLCLLSPALLPLAERIGMVILGIASTAGTAALIMGLWLFPQIEVWYLLRFLLGGTIAGAFVISETWINQLATPDNRGRVIGLYATVVAAGFALGPATIAILGPDGVLPFAIIAGLSCLSALVVYAVRHRTPPLERHEGASMRRFLVAAPVLVLGVGVVALFEQGSLSLLPLYFLGFGMTEQAAAAALTVMVAGNIALQMPIGWLADKTDSRRVMLGCLAVGTVGAALLPLVAAGGWMLWALLLIWGSAAYGVYTTAMMELGHRFDGTMLVAGNAAFAVAFGIGGLIGPSVGGAVMAGSGPHGFPILLAVIYGIVLMLAWWRHRVRQTATGSDAQAGDQS